MAGVFVRHKVENFAKWKSAFDNHYDVRKAGGEKSYALGNVHGDPLNLCVYFVWDNAENAKKFLESEDLAEAMKEAGVIEKPEIFIIDEYEKGAA